MSDLAARLALGQVAASLAGALALGLVLLATRQGQGGRAYALAVGLVLAAWLAWSLLAPHGGAWLLAGLLDPIPLATRSVNLVLLPLADAPARVPGPSPVFTRGPGLSRRCFWSPCCSICGGPASFAASYAPPEPCWAWWAATPSGGWARLKPAVAPA